MRIRRTLIPLVAAASTVTIPLTFAGPASASAQPHHTIINKTVLAPFNLAFAHGRVLVADGGTSLVSRIDTDGSLHTVASGPQPGEVSGVATGGGATAYTSLDYSNGDTKLTITRPGQADVVADISGYERANNPDQKSFYGVRHPSACVTKALTKMGAPVSYHGVVDSHAYSVAYAGAGWWYVAEAAGNDILKVSPSGQVQLVRVLPPQPTTFTAQSAKAAGLPKCFAGVTYSFEPVPTDVEVWNGRLYISTLPGGPEDPSFGARGSVYRMRANGTGLTRLATGFAGATNLAVSPTGRVFVTELFGGQISTIWHGQPKPVLSLPGAVSVEWHAGALYAGTLGPSDDQGNPTGPGSVVRISLG
jgi:hypothetical protein